MSIIVDADRTIIHHVPRTAGMWIRSALEANGLDYQIVYGHWDQDLYPTISKIVARPDVDPTKLLNVEQHHLPTQQGVVIYRDAYPWYRSYWQFRQNSRWGWHEAREIDRSRADDFPTFLDKILRYYGDFHSQLYQDYSRWESDRIDLIALVPWLRDRYELKVIPPKVNAS